MKKSLLILGITLMSSTICYADKTNSPSWERQADNYYHAFNSSEGSSFLESSIYPVGQNTKDAHVGFRLVFTNKDFCKDKDDKFGAEYNLYIDDESVAFNVTCYQHEYVNLFPISRKGIDYILDRFNSNEPSVKIVFSKPDSKDSIYSISTENFRPIYRSIKKSVKKTK